MILRFLQFRQELEDALRASEEEFLRQADIERAGGSGSCHGGIPGMPGTSKPPELRTGSMAGWYVGKVSLMPPSISKSNEGDW